MSAQTVDVAYREDVVLDLREAAAPTVVRTLGLDIELPAPGPYLRFVKPAVDRLVAATLLLFLVPLLLGLMLIVRLRLGPGVLFRQERIGLGGEPFTVYKLRTMLPDRRRAPASFAGDDRRRTHKAPDDPRHTPLGRFLRRWSLDELPQLVNVLRGEMSLVGPRPELPGIVARYEPWQHARHAVRPGLTGPWQISARSMGPMHSFTELDVDYAQRVSPLVDLGILARTLPALLGSQRGS
ncbi:MAG TPA: sugar transferase [Acidimicrobiales bacterium]|nr:sugar transferase [Acidimicrobiales bacterium]